MTTAKKKDPMALWNQVCVTDPSTTKKVTVGRKFTTVCAQSQIKKATELWGAMGSEWGVRDEKFTMIMGDQISLYQAILYYPGGELPIHSDIEIMFHSGKRAGTIQDDFSKKQATDAMTKGLSKLGFNADIFEGKFDDNKYIQAAAQYHQEQQQPQSQQPQEPNHLQEPQGMPSREDVLGLFSDACIKLLDLNPDAVLALMRQIPQCQVTPDQTIDTLTKDQEKYIETNHQFFLQQGCGIQQAV